MKSGDLTKEIQKWRFSDLIRLEHNIWSRHINLMCLQALFKLFEDFGTNKRFDLIKIVYKTFYFRTSRIPSLSAAP